MLLAVVSLMAFFIRRSLFLRKSVLFMTCGSLTFGFYHLGVENKWWAAPAKCATKLSSAIDSQDVARHIMEAKTPNCDQVNFDVLGVSVTLLAFILSAGLFWISSIAYFVAESNSVTKRAKTPKN
jgi:disulfide bond formation protein DsbB